MSLDNFLDSFISKVQKKSRQVNQATWVLETTGSKDAANLKAELELELRLLFHDKTMFNQLVSWNNDNAIQNAFLKRQLNILIRLFKPNLATKEILQNISEEESNLSFLYSNFRAQIKGRRLSDNDIKEILKTETNVEIRKETWEASKEIGNVLAPHILKLVKLRNEAANSLGYTNFFSMQLDLQEIDEEWLFEILDHLAEASEPSYSQVIDQINTRAATQFNVSKDSIGPWAWSEPFCQEDPIDAKELDNLVKGVDMIGAVKDFYKKMGFNIEDILKRSDNFERPGKSQHAFCLNIDRENDIRILNNIKPTIKWLETLLHEVGHAVYECGYNPQLPWLLKEPPHMITTEAVALLFGRQAYRMNSLEHLLGKNNRTLRENAEVSLNRRQLIFSRWVLVMTYFEKALYQNPDHDLNVLWWQLVEKYQKIKSAGRSNQFDWASKYHIGLAPVYYFSYLLGELLASSIEEMIDCPSTKAGEFLDKKLFKTGNCFHWNTLIENATGKKLMPTAWLSQFAR